MERTLLNEEIRVLGCLMEKEMATPEYYPLSLNALLNACNQKSNRDPVVAYDEETLRKAIDGLTEKGLVWQSNVSRVPKYEETFIKENDLISREAALICVLMLRGPQTAGELRGRTERLFEFENLQAVNSTLDDLISRGHVVSLPRQPGRKEVRYSHLLGEELMTMDKVSQSPQALQKGPGSDDRILALEEKVEYLSGELSELKELFKEFKSQFV